MKTFPTALLAATVFRDVRTMLTHGDDHQAAMEKKQEIRVLMQQLNAAEDEGQKKVFTRIIRDLVSQSFDLTTARRQAAIDSGEKRLAEARKHLDEAKLSLERRKENKDKHIDNFMEKLLADDPEKALGPRYKGPKPKPETKPE